jgi:hypothetical protein
MDDANALISRLNHARDELHALERELPTFAKWRDDHQNRVDAARAGKAAPGELAKLTGQLSTARELLSQHSSDITAARDLVGDLERELEQLELCKQIRRNYAEIERWSEDWAEEMFGALNNFIESALDLGAARFRYLELHADAQKLRAQLTIGLEPMQRGARCAELGITEPDSLRDYGPQSWLPRNMTAPLEPVQSPVITAFERLMTMPKPHRAGLLIKPRGNSARYHPLDIGPNPLQPPTTPTNTPQTSAAADASEKQHGLKESARTLEVKHG